MVGRITAFLFFVLLVWGNLVAGMKAGLACPDWPLCRGELLPPLHLDVWMEFLHRVIAALASVSLFVLAGQRWKAYRGWSKAIPLAAILLLVGQIVIGGVVVLLGLPVQLTTVHFMVALGIFVLVLYMVQCDGVLQPPVFGFSGYSGLLFSMVLLMFSQASLGAYLRHSGSAMACTGFLACQGSWIPDVWDLAIAINYGHRLIALALLSTAAILFAFSLLDRDLSFGIVRGFALLFLVALQLMVGAAVVKSGFQFSLTAVHLAIALLSIWLGLRLWLRQVNNPEGIQK
ncbi:COX15/CtaA family protein [Geomesophilobacter sediminis]|uniref:Heme A synthase n=1 Tax=Geomesophilobacter sediminis TaxID=2798584 RepID=A0A8J7LU08_9BACT|nr:COX15/CtaA family protein [Geomesophilobacter sediminis]MBJ6724034.1 heme A synthase [Geomesophilobacter sediminis]